MRPKKTDRLAACREFYAKMVAAGGGQLREDLERAFEIVPREYFLGPGPWIATSSVSGSFVVTPTDDPIHVYQNVLFLILNAYDGPEVETKNGSKHFKDQFSKKQLDYIKLALEENPSVRWTVVALHPPIWSQSNVVETGWLEVEKFLAGRNYTVFCGHIHNFRKYVRQGMNYYQLATTGGAGVLPARVRVVFALLFAGRLQAAWLHLAGDAAARPRARLLPQRRPGARCVQTF